VTRENYRKSFLFMSAMRGPDGCCQDGHQVIKEIVTARLRFLAYALEECRGSWEGRKIIADDLGRLTRAVEHLIGNEGLDLHFVSHLALALQAVAPEDKHIFGADLWRLGDGLSLASSGDGNTRNLHYLYRVALEDYPSDGARDRATFELNDAPWTARGTAK